MLADKLIEAMTEEAYLRVFNTKVTGFKTLLEEMDTSALEHVGLFSSAAARFGNPGQAAYAMANEVLNRVAYDLADRLPNLQVKSFNWGPWDGGMVDAGLKRHFEAKGIGLIPRKAGADLFADHLLYGARDEIELLVGDDWTANT